MKNRRKFGRRKGDYITRYLLITSLIAHVIVAGVVIAGCEQMNAGIGIKTPDTGVEVGGGVPGGSPAKIPVAHFNAADGTNATFTLTWAEQSAGDTDIYIYTELDKVLTQWNAYAELFNSLPQGPAGTYLSLETQRSYLALNNSSSSKVILRRWWPAGVPQTHTAWIASNSQRRAGFLTARAAIQAVMAELKGSPYYDRQFYLSVGMQPSPLKTAVTGMEAFILAPNAGDVRENFRYLLPDGATRGMPTLWAGTGLLYEAYFGYVPMQAEYVNPSPDLMAYPE
jgi:hypothetical protein